MERGAHCVAFTVLSVCKAAACTKLRVCVKRRLTGIQGSNSVARVGRSLHMHLWVVTCTNPTLRTVSSW